MTKHSFLTSLSEIFNIIVQLPTSKNNKSAYFVKFARKSNREIVQSLIYDRRTSVEHVKPHSLGGQNDTSNYILMCAKCNSLRGNMSYADWIKAHPQMKQNLQNYINTMAKLIETGQVEDLEPSYIVEVIETVEIESGGKIKLKNPFNDDIDYPISIKIENETLEQKKARLKQLQLIQNGVIQDKEFKDLKSYFALQKQLQYSLKRKQEVEMQIDNALREVNSANDIAMEIAGVDIAILQAHKKRHYQKQHKLSVKKEELERQKASLSSNLTVKQLEEKLDSVVANEINPVQNALRALKEHIIFPEDIDKEIVRLREELRKIKEIDIQISQIEESLPSEDCFLEDNKVHDSLFKAKAKYKTLEQEVFLSDSERKTKKALEQEINRLEAKQEDILKIAQEYREKKKQITQLSKEKQKIYASNDIFGVNSLRKKIEKTIQHKEKMQYYIELLSSNIEQEIMQLRIDIDKMSQATPVDHV